MTPVPAFPATPFVLALAEADRIALMAAIIFSGEASVDSTPTAQYCIDNARKLDRYARASVPAADPVWIVTYKLLGSDATFVRFGPLSPEAAFAYVRAEIVSMAGVSHVRLSQVVGDDVAEWQ